MAATAPKNPAYFKIRGADALLARKGNLWLGVGYSALDSDQVEIAFERNDEQIEAAAVDKGFDGHWISSEEVLELRSREDLLLTCRPGGYAWDDWQRYAIVAGVPDDLAALGRAVMREAYQHSWREELRDECGAGREEGGESMIFEALEQPDWARSRWGWLLATDGLRSDPWTRNETSPLDLEWTPLRQQWEDENFPLEASTGDAALRRDAYRFLEEFYELDQLALISLTDEAFNRSKDRTTYFADFAIMAAPPEGRFHLRIMHSGVIQSRYDPKVSPSFDTVVFQRIEEGDQFE